MGLFSLAKEIFQRYNKNVFYRILIIFICTISIPVISIGILSINYSKNHIVEQISQSNNNILYGNKLIIEQRISEIDELIYQIFADNKVMELLGCAKITAREYETISEIIKDFRKTIAGNEMIDSIYLYDDKLDYIVADAKYQKTDFYDSIIFKRNYISDFYVSPLRIVNLPSTGANKKVISCIRRFRDFSNNKVIFVLINVKYESLFSELNTVNNLYPLFLFIFDDGDSLAFTDLEPSNILNAGNLGKISAARESSFIQKIDKTDYFICKSHSNMLGWTFAYIQTYKNLVQTAALVRNMIISSLVIILLLSFILSYLFSVYLYKPLAKLVLKVEKSLNLKGLKNINEYEIIDNAVKNMLSQNNELQSHYELAFPYLQEHSIVDLLNNKISDGERFRSIITLLGVQFIYSNYITAVIDLENTEITDKIKQYIDKYFSDLDNEILQISSIINDNRLVIIINTEKDMETVFSVFDKLKCSLNRDGIIVTISIGRAYNSLDKICLSYQKALHQLENKFFSGKNEIIVYKHNEDESSKKALYDRKIEEELLNCIKSQDLDKAGLVLKTLNGNILGHTNSIEYIKYIYFQIVSNIIYLMADIGNGMEETGMDFKDIFEKIQKVRSLNELLDFILALIEKSISRLADLKKKQLSDMVCKIIQYIKDNYNKDMSIEDISSKIFISPRYLSGIFKDQTGMTVYDYITQLRMEAARDLILSCDMKVQDIAQSVGYNSIQSFLRFFKKYYNMTPVEFKRKKLLSSADS